MADNGKKGNSDEQIEKARQDGYVCVDCGVQFLSDEQLIGPDRVHTYHLNTCGLCGEKKSVTHVRAYNYLQKPTNNG